MQNSGTAQNWEGHCLSQHCIKTAVTFSPTLSHTLNIDKSIKQCTKLFWARALLHPDKLHSLLWARKYSGTVFVLLTFPPAGRLERRKIFAKDAEQLMVRLLTVQRNIFSWIEKLVCSRWTLESLVNTWGGVCTVMNGHSVSISAQCSRWGQVQSVTDSLSQQQYYVETGSL